MSLNSRPQAASQESTPAVVGLRAGARTRLRRGAALCVGFALTAGLLAPGALADQVSQEDIDASKNAEATTSASIASLEAQLAELSTKADLANMEALAANESYLEAKVELDNATAEADAAQAEADAASEKTKEARKDLGAVVVQTYQDGGNALSALTPYLTSQSLADFADAGVALERAGENSDAQVQSVEAQQAVADTMQGIADSKRASKQQASDAAETARLNAESASRAASQAVSSAHAERTSLIAQLAAQRNTTIELETQYQEQLEAQRQAAAEEAARKAAEEAASQAAAEQAAQEAAQQAAAEEAARQAAAQQAAAAAAQAQQQAAAQQAAAAAAAQQQAAASQAAANVSGSGVGTSAVNAAYNYLGVPYVWGGESYSGMDCSGLTMLAYRAVGISIPHSSRMQYGYGSKVSVNNLQAGDLVFWSSNGTQSGIYHVAIYIGGGQMIEAPVPGQTVKVTSMRYSGGLMPYGVRF